jgi:DNA topoisomerase I
VPRLRRSDCAAPGITRRRRGRGFEYLDPDGERIDDPETLERIAELAIPPAWRDVWICLDPLGHLQATGIDNAGRKQYRYHDQWRARRDREKFGSMVEFGHALPQLRRRVQRDLRRDALDRARVLACATRLLDVGFFRIGSEDYAVTNETYGLATMLRRHVSVEEDEVVFDYPAKSGQRRVHTITDENVRTVVSALKRRRGGGPELLAYKDGGRWADVRSDGLNA